MIGRRDKIARYWFDEVPPLDFFQVVEGTVDFADLAVERGHAAASGTTYRYRMAAENAERQRMQRSAWQVVAASQIPVLMADGALLPGIPQGDETHQFLALEVQVNRGQGWSSSTTAHFSLLNGHTVAVDR